MKNEIINVQTQKLRRLDHQAKLFLFTVNFLSVFTHVV